MAASNERLEREKNITETPRNVGLTLTVKVTAYDKGTLEVDGTPMDGHITDAAGEAWLAAAMVIAQKLHHFQREVARRQAAQHDTTEETS